MDGKRKQVLPDKERLMTIPCDSELLTIDEAASLMRLKSSTLRDWVWKRKIPYVKFSGRVFIRRSDIEELIRTSLVPAATVGHEENQYALEGEAR